MERLTNPLIYNDSRFTLFCMETYTPDPFKNYQMKGAPASPASPDNAPDLSRLDDMTVEELRGLVRRVSGAIWGIALQTPEEIAEAMKLKLAAGGLTEKDMFKALPLMREWFDRQIGKASQSIAMTVEDKGLGKLSDERLLRLESTLARMTGEQAIVIAPEPKRLEDSTDSQ